MNISASANADGVLLSFPTSGGALPPSVKVILDDGIHKFERCPATTDGTQTTVTIPRRSALQAEAGAQVSVEIPDLGVEGLVIWPPLPPSTSGRQTKVSDQNNVRNPSRPTLRPDLPSDNGDFPRPPKEPPLAPGAQTASTNGPHINAANASTSPAGNGQAAPFPQTAPRANAPNRKSRILAIIGAIILILAIIALLWALIFKHVRIPFLSSLFGHTPSIHAPVPHLPSLPNLPSLSHALGGPAQGTGQIGTATPPVNSETPTPSSNTPLPPTNITGTNEGVDLTSMSVPEVVQRAPTPAAIGHEGERRLSVGKKDDGLLLLEAAADKGDSHSMGDLAHIYDPAHFNQNGPVPKADEDEAARYYQQASKTGDKSLDADRAQLRDSLQKRADDDDNDARLTLKNYFEGSTQP